LAKISEQVLTAKTKNERWQLDDGVEIDGDQDEMADSLLHKIMLLFHEPASWSGWKVALAMGLGIGLVGLFWGLMAGNINAGASVFLLMALFIFIDALWLNSLPRRGISFGSWQAQLFVFAVPRLAVALVVGVFAGWLGWIVCWGITAVIQLIGSILLFYATAIEPFKLSLSTLEVSTDRLSPETKPIRLLQISDLHVEYLTKREARVLEIVNEAQPDLVVISGDYVNLSNNRDPKTLAQVRELLSQINAPYGVYAVLGTPLVDLAETVAPLFEELPIVLMRGEWQKVDVGNGRYLTIIGMDCTHNLPIDRERLAKLVETAPNHSPQLFLFHSPEMMPEAAAHDIDLYLCGHTHGGQVRLPLIGPLLTSSQLGRRFVMGLYKMGRTHLYISRGIGLEGLSAPRVRFLCPPEMTLVKIKPLSGDQ
jgi:predicted MPP superfamily phosphohydrolase